LAAVNAKEQELLTERANIIAELEDKFGVEREGLQTNIANLEGTVTDLQANIDALTQERDAAIAEQDVIRATAADEQAKALADQRADLQGQIDTLSASQTGAAVTTTAEMPTAADVTSTYNPDYMGFEDERMIGRQNEADALANLQAASAAGTATLGDVQAAKNASANLIAQQAVAPKFSNNFVGRAAQKAIEKAQKNLQEQQAFPVTGQDLGLTKQPNLPVTNPVVEDYAPIRKDTIPTDVVSQLQNMNIRQPNLNFNNLRLGMAGGGDINKIEILLRRLG